MAEDRAPVLTLEAAEARNVLGFLASPPVAQARLGQLAVEVQLEGGNFWVVLRRDGRGGVALRMPTFSGGDGCRTFPLAGSIAALECRGRLGTARLVLRGDNVDLEQLRVTLEFTPQDDLSIGQLPRDLVPFDEAGDPFAVALNVEASQRKMNTGLLYFAVKQPDFGKILYVQNFTALNDYFNATGSNPDSAVAAELPEMGYRPPLNSETGRAVLPAGKCVTLYDTIIAVLAYPQTSEEDSAWQFLDMLGDIYSWLAPPVPAYRDWHRRAQATVSDLLHAPEARIEHYGHVYFHPYTASEYPDPMVQLSIGSALLDWSRWTGVRHPMLREIVAGLDKFYDPDLKTLRRYLPNVGKDKDRDAVDSWYLYHPMLNLANIALGGDEVARDLFLKSIDYGIDAAHHFRYKWPIIYNIRDFSVIREVSEADQRGQTDVGGIYAWVMLQAFELTHESRYLEEAIRAIDAAKGMKFDLNYQANLTAWGAVACIRLWRITGRKDYLTQSYVYLASFFHNSQFWESEIGLARHSRNFMGVTCLEDAPYMAAYECFDSFAAFERYLDFGGPDLVPAVRMLVSEYCRHALDRAWFYYPDTLPENAVATDVRNGYILRALNFPMEDLYPDGQKAGQVGQEIYGAGAALIYATRAFHKVDDAPFLLYCDAFIRAVHRIGPNALSLRVDGPADTKARLALVPSKAPLTSIAPRLWNRTGEQIAFNRTEDGRLEAWVPIESALLLRW